MTDPAPLKETDFMRFEDLPNPRRVTRFIAVWSKSQGYKLGHIRWYWRWRQYVFEPSKGTLFNVSCLADLADRLGYLNTMHRNARRKAKL
jgi:hypothetical protein